MCFFLKYIAITVLHEFFSPLRRQMGVRLSTELHYEKFFYNQL